MMLVIDNYDSFTYNLVQALSVLGEDLKVVRNDEITTDEIAALAPDSILISPGPCTPAQAGVSVETVQRFSGTIPLLGVCLGHQSIAAAFGAPIDHAQRIMHGKTSPVRYESSPLYDGLENPFPAGRYHSLSVREAVLPEVLVADAWADDGEVMGMHHREHPTWGVQFHPESVLTPDGDQLLGNFLNAARAFNTENE